MKATAAPIYAVQVRQNGSGGLFLMERADMEALYRAIYVEGAIVAVWQAADGASVGVLVNPAVGGLSINMAPAGPIPVDADGNMCSPDVATSTMSPDRFPAARVVTPEWYLKAVSAHEGTPAAPPQASPTIPGPPAAPPPAPKADPLPSPVNGATRRGNAATA